MAKPGRGWDCRTAQTSLGAPSMTLVMSRVFGGGAEGYGVAATDVRGSVGAWATGAAGVLTGRLWRRAGPLPVRLARRPLPAAGP